MFRILVITIFILLGLNSYAQEVARVKGSAQVLITDNLSKEDAIEEAREKAKINAIENRFGTYVEQDSDVEINNGNTDFKIIGHTRVKGDWLKTTHEKFKEDKRRVRGLFRKSDEIWISCEIEGLVREIKNPELNLDIMPLNCKDPVCRTYDFKDGEPMYLFFRSPQEGFLSVFAVQEDLFAYRLLPYQTMTENYLQAVPVDPDKEYLFFANDKKYDFFPGFSYMMIDELEMTTLGSKEYLDLYVIFSPNRFKKPLLRYSPESVESGAVPSSLTRDDFEDWILENRIYDPLFQYKRITLTIFK